MNLPTLQSPQNYVGLYVYDFGDYAAIGYTADEIAMLRRNPQHEGGDAYIVRSADASGRIAMEGVSALDLISDEAIVFAHRDADAARKSFDVLESLAVTDPLPCPVRIELADCTGNNAPHAVALIYKSHSSHAVSSWLEDAGFGGGDMVSGGDEALDAYRKIAAPPIATSHLTCRMNHASRSEEEVLRRVNERLQR